MSLFQVIGVVVCLVALFGYLNHQWVRSSHSIGITVIGVVEADGAAGVVIALSTRLARVGPAILVTARLRPFRCAVVAIMTWRGLHDGISIALDHGADARPVRGLPRFMRRSLPHRAVPPSGVASTS